MQRRSGAGERGFRLHHPPAVSRRMARFACGLATTVALAAVVAACDSGAQGAGPPAEEAGAETLVLDGGACAPPPGPVFENVSDGAIVAMLQAEHEAEIGLAQQFEWRLSSPDTVAFAEKALTDHTLLLLGLRGPCGPITSGWFPTTTAWRLPRRQRARPQWFSDKSGAELDRAYIAYSKCWRTCASSPFSIACSPRAPTTHASSTPFARRARSLPRTRCSPWLRRGRSWLCPERARTELAPRPYPSSFNRYPNPCTVWTTSP